MMNYYKPVTIESCPRRKMGIYNVLSRSEWEIHRYFKPNMIIILSFKNILTLCVSLSSLSSFSLLIISVIKTSTVMVKAKRMRFFIFFIFLSFSMKILDFDTLCFKERSVFSGLHFIPRVILDHLVVAPSDFLRAYLSIQLYLGDI